MNNTALTSRSIESRKHQSYIKRMIESSEMTIYEAIFHASSEPLNIDTLLMCQRRWGRTRATQLLEEAEIYGKVKVRDLSDGQKATIIELIENHPSSQEKPLKDLGTKRIPAKPFQEWLKSHDIPRAELAMWLGVNPRSLRRIMNQKRVTVQFVDHCLTRGGSALSLLYPEI